MTIPPYVFVLVHAGLATWSVYHALLYKRDPRAAMGWIMASLFVPYAGPIAYALFGINRVRSPGSGGIRHRFFSVGYESGQRLARLEPGSSAGIRQAGHRVTGRALCSGNDVTPLYNGESAYPAMLASIEKAQHRVLLATYILMADETGTAFAAALEAAKARGVEVKILLDGVGEYYSLRRGSALLRRRKLEVARFLPPRIVQPTAYINLRNHRKLLLIDDSCAYAGGMNISDDHISAPGRPRRISDVHFALRGPIVAELAHLFFHDWRFATRKPAEHPDDAPLAPCGEMDCRMVPDGPNEQMDALALTIQAAVSAASVSIDIMTPYFLPSPALTASLQSAALRGVRVRVVLPQKNNLFFVHWAHRNLLAELLKWDIEVFYQPPPFCHSKLLCIDDEYSLIGSANLDPRSLRLNFELGIEVFSVSLNAELRAHISQSIASGTAVTYEELAGRPLAIRLRDSAAALFSPYL